MPSLHLRAPAARLAAGKTGKEVTGVSAKREHILIMPLAAYESWADRLVEGFLQADQFLRHLGFHDPKYLPYRAQVIPLGATLALIGDRWLRLMADLPNKPWARGRSYPGCGILPTVALNVAPIEPWRAHSTAGVLLPAGMPAVTGFRLRYFCEKRRYLGQKMISHQSDRFTAAVNTSAACGN